MFTSLALATIVLCAVYGCIKVLRVSWTQMFAMDCHDCEMFWTVGQGILNGLVPYKDLFETKPPGIFLLSSFSLLLTNSRMLGGIAVALATTLLACIPPCYAYAICRKQTLPYKVAALSLSILFGVMMVFYIERSSFNYMPEQFGAFFSALYVLTIALLLQKKDERAWYLRTFAGGTCLFLAGFMKEPFVLSAIAAGLFLSHSIQDVTRNILMPLLFSGTQFLIALLGLRVVVPYFTIYLTTIMGLRVDSASPLWLRGIHPTIYKEMVHNMASYSPYVVAVIGVLFAVLVVRSAHVSLRKKRSIVPITLVLLGVYSIAVAISTGGSMIYSQHFLFAIPAYIAVFCIALRYIVEHSHMRHVKVLTIGIGLLLVLVTTSLPNTPFTAWASESRAERSGAAVAAKQLDALLDRCNLDRYLYVGPVGRKLYGSTTHSPLGPLFSQHQFYFDGEDAYWEDAFIASMKQAHIVVYDWKNTPLVVRNIVDPYLMKYFTKIPWHCVGKYPVETEEIIYYRVPGT